MSSPGNSEKIKYIPNWPELANIPTSRLLSCLEKVLKFKAQELDDDRKAQEEQQQPTAEPPVLEKRRHLLPGGTIINLTVQRKFYLAEIIEGTVSWAEAQKVYLYVSV